MWFDALETIEVGIRTQVAHVLGQRDPFGHVNRAALDDDACRDTVQVGGNRIEAFDVWLDKYNDMRSKAVHEDYVQHNLHKYEGHPPVWIAMELPALLAHTAHVAHRERIYVPLAGKSLRQRDSAD